MQPERVQAARIDFDAFYREARPWALRLAHLLTSDRALAEDLVQDAFSNLHPRYDTVDNPGAFLRTSVVNACRSAHRRRARERARLLRSYERVRDEQPEVREMLDAIARLPYRQRAVVVLRYYSDLPERDIAVVLGCRPGTVKSLASRALAALRASLRDTSLHDTSLHDTSLHDTSLHDAAPQQEDPR